jgi:hypothetical protein
MEVGLCRGSSSDRRVMGGVAGALAGRHRRKGQVWSTAGGATVLGLPVARARPGNVLGVVVGVVSVKGGGLPAERGELARAGDRDDAGGLAPLVVRVRSALMQAMLGAPRDVDRAWLWPCWRRASVSPMRG